MDSGWFGKCSGLLGSGRQVLRSGTHPRVALRHLSRPALRRLPRPSHPVESLLVERFSPKAPFYVISHERSGTHFLINTLTRNTYIRPGRGRIGAHQDVGQWTGPYDDPTDRFNHIDDFFSNWPARIDGPTIVKSHCDRDLFSLRYRQAPVLYVLRDPRDTLVSFYHYLNHPKFYEFNPHLGNHRCSSFSEFLRRPVTPMLQYGFSLHGEFSNVAERWARHVAGWFQAPGSLVVRYEDLLTDYDAVLQRVASFLGLRLRLRRSPVGLHEGLSHLPRKGVMGDWATLFSKADEEFLRAVIEDAGLDWQQLTSPPGGSMSATLDAQTTSVTTPSSSRRERT